MDNQKNVPEYVKRSAKYKNAKKEARAQKNAMNPKRKKAWIIVLCAVLLVALIGLAIWLFTAPSAPGEGGQGNPGQQSETFDPSLGVPDYIIEALVRERYERHAAITATFDAKVTNFEITHNVVDNKQDLATVTATAESEICKKTFKLDLIYNVSDEAWVLEKGEESVVSTEWVEEKLLGWWTGGTTAESLHELNIIDIDLENRRAHFFNQGREFYNEQIYHWNTGEIEILPSNDAAPYVIDYDGMRWNNDYMMFPTEEGQLFY